MTSTVDHEYTQEEEGRSTAPMCMGSPVVSQDSEQHGMDWMDAILQSEPIVEKAE